MGKQFQIRVYKKIEHTERPKKYYLSVLISQVTNSENSSLHYNNFENNAHLGSLLNWSFPLKVPPLPLRLSPFFVLFIYR